MIGFLLLFALSIIFSGGIMLAAGETPKVVAAIMGATFIPALALFAIIFPDVLARSF